MRSYLLCLLVSILALSCSKNIDKSLIHSLTIKSDKEIISDIGGLESKLIQYINKTSIQNISVQDVFENSWLSSIKADYSLDNSIAVEIKEHHPIVSTGQDKYITQRGISINPTGLSKKLSLMKVKGPNNSLAALIKQSRELQTKLHKLDLRVISFELKNKDQLKAKDELGTEYIFSQKEFRVQLERLEDYISFELNSGKLNHIRYIDFRYNNAIAVYHS